MPTAVRTMHTEESAEVEVLFANMDKLKTLTKKIQASLNRLDASGQSVQDAIRPIYGNTSRLQVTNANIEKVNIAIDKIRQPLDKRRREEPIIRGGLQRYSLSEYLAALDRVQEALTSLEQSNLKSNQHAIGELNDLLHYGCQQLEIAFRDSLAEDSRAVEPLHYITKSIPFPAIPAEKSSKLRHINSYMKSSTAQVFRSNDRQLRTSNIYAEVRGGYLSLTLHNLATASVTTVRKTDSTALYRQGQSGITSYCKAMEDLFASEYNVLCEIFARDQWVPLHTSTCQSALQELAQTLRELHSHIQANLVTDCFLAYELIDVVSRLSTRLDSKNPELRQPIHDALRPIKSVAKYSLQKLLEDPAQQIQNLITIPADGSPLQITFNTMKRLQTMTSYLSPLGPIMASVGEAGWRSPELSGPGAPNIQSTNSRSFDVGISSTELFSSYLGDTLDSLLSALDSKSRSLLKTKSAQGMFLANNAAIVERYMSSPDLAETQSEASRQKKDRWKKKGIDAYSNAWDECSKQLLDQFHTSRSSQGGRPPSGQAVDSAAFLKNLSGKERDAIKERFRSFSAAFDDLVARHRSFHVEPEVKAELAAAVQQKIEPLYTRFWDRYHDIDKGKNKVVKYDKQQVSGILAALG